MLTEYELTPQYDVRASFYRKARVRENDLGDKALLSYGTPVCWIDRATGNFHRLWAGWSSTTGRHVKEFCAQHTSIGTRPAVMCKKDWDAMEVEELPPFCR